MVPKCIFFNVPWYKFQYESSKTKMTSFSFWEDPTYVPICKIYPKKISGRIQWADILIGIIKIKGGKTLSPILPDFDFEGDRSNDN